MKKLLALILFPIFIFAQSENQSQSIELPDFVITGKQTVSLPMMKKIQPKVIPVLSKEFFYPSFTPKDFSLANIPMPQRKSAELFPKQKYYNAHLILGAGRYTLPKGEFTYGQPFGSGQFYTKLWGSNTTDYVPSSDYNVSGIKLNTQFFVNRNSSFMPGLGIGITGYFIRDNYKFYGSLNPQLERETQKGGAEVSLENQYNENVKYGFNFIGDYLDFKKSSYKELLYSGSGFMKIKMKDFSIKFSGKYLTQKIDRTSLTDSYNYYYGNSNIDYNLNNSLNIKLGAAFYHGDQYQTNGKSNLNLFAPWMEVSYKINKRFTLYGKYIPKSEFKTTQDFLEKNKFIYVAGPAQNDVNADNVFSKYKNNAEVTLKFAYDKYYEINFGGKFQLIDNYYYFESSTNVIPYIGQFRIVPMGDNEVTKYELYIDALYHLGPFGWFYGDAKFKSIEDGFNRTIPYEPKYELNAVYGYNFRNGFSFEIGMKYLRGMYTDIANKNQLKDYINLRTKISYSLLQNLDLTLDLYNILNNDNYLWQGYLEKPFDIIGGIDYRF